LAPFSQLVNGAHESSGSNLGEGDRHIDQNDPDEEQHRAAGIAAQILARDLRNRTALMANRRGEARKIMNRADEDDAESNPDQRRQPAPVLGRKDRPGDRPRRRDRGKVLPEQIKRTGRDKIHSVIQFVRGREPLVVDTKLSRHPCSVKPVGDGQNRNERYRQESQIHGLLVSHHCGGGL
jgi:hypothetical protein